MDILAQELKAGKQTVGQIAEKHNVSKARLEAIRKLKMVESEFVRQVCQDRLSFPPSLLMTKQHDILLQDTNNNLWLQHSSLPEISHSHNYCCLRNVVLTLAPLFDFRRSRFFAIQVSIRSYPLSTVMSESISL